MPETTRFHITYRSLTDLADDHATYLSRGGIAVPLRQGALPPSGAASVIRISVPGGASYELTGKVDRVVEGRGFTVLFDGSAQQSLHAITQLVQSPHFQRVKEAESPSAKNTRTIQAYDPAEAAPVAPAPVPVRAAPPSPSPAASVGEDSYDDYDDEPDEDGSYDDDDDEIDENEEIGTQESDEDVKPASFKTPGPGDSYVVYVVKYATVMQYAEVAPAFGATAKLTIPYANDPAKEGDLAQLRLTLPGRNIFRLYAVIEKVRQDSVELRVSADSPAFLNASVFPRTVSATKRMQNEKEYMFKPVEVLRFVEERNADDLENMPIRRRIQRMSMDDKVNMALSGTREERMALALDGNKSIHHYLLKNARISLDEIAFIARLPTMNPDVLAKIGENPQYTQNPTVLKNLVYNPKTPVTLAIRLLDRLPRSEVMNLSKRMSMNAKLVQAAKKKIEGRSR